MSYTMYVDEQYLSDGKTTVLSFVALTDQQVKEIVNEIKKIIKSHERDRKNLSMYLTELKLYKLKHKKYFVKIVEILDNITSHFLIKVNSTPANKNFINEYRNVLSDYESRDVKIIIDRITSVSYTNQITNGLLNITNGDSREYPGIQIADLLLYKIK